MSSACVWPQTWCPSVHPHGRRAFKPPSKGSMRSGRPKYGRVFITIPCPTSKPGRPTTSPPITGEPWLASKRPHPGDPFPGAGGGNSMPPCMDKWSICDARANMARCSCLGHTFTVDPRWAQRLVRCEVELEAGSMAFYALRRREPSQQPLLRAAPFMLPQSVAPRGR
jgi:hypothetical protein